MLLNVDTDHWSITLPLQAPWIEFVQAVTAARQFIREQGGQAWLLQHPNRDVFAVWLIALLCERKTPLLPSSGQPETLAQLTPDADQITPAHWPAVAPAAISWPVTLSGALSDALVLYTSGSSGAPKPVPKTLRQVFAEVHTLEQTFGALIDQSLVTTTVTHQHIYGLIFTVIWPLCTGRKVHSERFEYPEQWQAFRQHNTAPYVLVSSPAQLERFCQVTPMAELDHTLTAVFSSGGPLNEQVPSSFVAADLTPPIEVYGSTETGGIAWRTRTQPTTPFTLLKGIHADSTGDNRLRIRSPHLASTDWYETSDKVTFVDAATFVIKGRADRIVKLAEKRVSLDEMEAYTERLDWVDKAKCCVLTGINRQELGLAVQLNQQGQEQLRIHGRFLLRQQLRNHLSQRFEPVVLPRKFRYLNKLPYNEAGKITQTALYQLFAEDTSL